MDIMTLIPFWMQLVTMLFAASLTVVEAQEGKFKETLMMLLLTLFSTTLFVYQMARWTTL